MKKLIAIPLILLIFSSCSLFDSGEDLREEAEEVLPSATWYVSSGDDGFEAWTFEESGSGTISQHNLPCGSEALNSYGIEYEIMEGPELRIEHSVEGESRTDIYDIQGVSDEEVVLHNQQEDQIRNLNINCEDI